MVLTKQKTNSNLIPLTFKKIRPVKPLCLSWKADYQDLTIYVRKLYVNRIYHFVVYRGNQIIYESIPHWEIFISYKDAVEYVNQFINRSKVRKKLGMIYPAG